MRHRALAAVLTIGAAAGPAGLAWAEPAAEEPQRVDDIVVTAQRSAEALSEAPVAVTAVDAAEARTLRLFRFSDLAAVTPGLTVQSKSPSDSVIVLRGVSNGDGSAYQEPRVSVFQDGAPLSRARAAVFELFDLERVEVLRGPQTTLFGRHALTGAVNVIQHKADPEPGGGFAIEAGSRGQRLFDGVVNAPLGDALAVRLAVRRREDAGRNADLLGGGRFGEGRTDATRLTFTARPTPAFRSDLILNLERETGTGQAFKSRTFRPADPETGDPLGDLSSSSGAALAAGENFEGGRPLGRERRLDGLVWLNRWRIHPDLELSAVTAGRRFESLEILDFDGFALPLLTVGDDASGEQWSQELRANWTPHPAVDAVFGLSAQADRGRQRIPLQIDERLVLALLTGRLDRTDPDLRPEDAYTAPAIQATLLRGVAQARGATLAPALAEGIASNLRGDHREAYADFGKSRGIDVYGDVAWRLTPRLQATAGLRYGWMDKVSGLSAEVEGRSVLAGFLGALSQPAAQRNALFAALAAPGAATRPPSATYPLPRFGLRAQPTAGGATAYAALDDEGLAGRLVLRYDLTDAVMTYASYGRGRRPRVLSPETPARPEGPVVFSTVSAEIIDAVEIGAKAAAPRYGLRMETALYRYVYRNFQTLQQQGAQYVVTDAGRAAAWGLEAEARWAPTPAFEGFAVLEGSHARFEDGAYAGNRFALQPDARATLGFTWTQAVPGGRVLTTPVYAWRGAHYFADDNGRPELMTGAFVAPLDFEPRQSAYGLLNLSVAFEPDHRRWRASVFATNALDARYIVEAGNGGEDFGLPTYVAGERRALGLRLEVAL